MDNSDRIHYNSLDGLRGFAFLVVLASHLSNVHGLFFSGIGHEGVWLFFILSAFLLSDYFIRNPGRVKSLYEWANYLFRRFLRIIPLFVIALFVYYLAGAISLQDVYMSLYFSYAYGHLWTIPVEFTFYLLLPILLLFIIYALREKPVPVLVSLLFFVGIIEFFYPESGMLPNSINMLYYLPVFLYGITVCIVNNQLRIMISDRYTLFFDMTGILLLLLSALTIPFVWSYLFYPVSYDYFVNMYVILGVIWAALLLSVINGKLLKRIFENKYLRWTGLISYNAYLFHILVINIVINMISNNDLIFIPLSIIIIFLSSSVIYILIEAPLSKIKLKDVIVIGNTMMHRLLNINYGHS